ncbi:hypothetical protein [Lacrimispora sphenoides]|uniref:hypothetical protein n=1 Tax=Lacrimispora sphenoides TaxID=29370 RepID=UPI0006D1D6E2|nr:hypothetical protein [Lacrimispora sphenoides]
MDQYLYPAFLRSGDSKLVNQAEEYQREMGNLLAMFTEFKDKYNTKIKILSEKESFFGEADKIMRSIDVRMQKEESGLYRLVR